MYRKEMRSRENVEQTTPVWLERAENGKEVQAGTYSRIQNVVYSLGEQKTTPV